MLFGQRIGKTVTGVLKGELAEDADAPLLCPCADRLIGTDRLLQRQDYGSGAADCQDFRRSSGLLRRAAAR